MVTASVDKNAPPNPSSGVGAGNYTEYETKPVYGYVVNPDKLEAYRRERQTSRQQLVNQEQARSQGEIQSRSNQYTAKEKLFAHAEQFGAGAVNQKYREERKTNFEGQNQATINNFNSFVGEQQTALNKEMSETPSSVYERQIIGYETTATTYSQNPYQSTQSTQPQTVTGEGLTIRNATTGEAIKTITGTLTEPRGVPSVTGGYSAQQLAQFRSDYINSKSVVTNVQYPKGTTLVNTYEVLTGLPSGTHQLTTSENVLFASQGFSPMGAQPQQELARLIAVTSTPQSTSTIQTLAFGNKTYDAYVSQQDVRIITSATLSNSLQNTTDSSAGLTASTISPYVRGTTRDINQAEFSTKITELFAKNNIGEYALNRLSTGYTNAIAKTWENRDMNRNPFLTEFANVGEIAKMELESISDIGATYVFGSTGYYNKYSPESAQKRVEEYTSQGIINPRESVLKEFSEEVPRELKSNFMLAKQAVESVAYLNPVTGVLQTELGIGRVEKVEEALVPIAIGATMFLGAGALGKAGQGTIGKLNTYLEGGLTKVFGSKLPVPEGVLATRQFANLINEQQVAKALPLVGLGAEIAGINFVPNEYKEEYIRQTSIYNAFIPIGFKTAQGATILGNEALVRGAEAFRGGHIFTPQELMDEQTFLKFSQTKGGTPIDIRNEREFILSSSGLDLDSVSRRYYELTGQTDLIGNTGTFFRSGRGSLENVIEPQLSAYEAGRQSFFSTNVHPIALKNTGLFESLFPTPDAETRYALYAGGNPYIENILVDKAVAIEYKGGIENFGRQQLQEAKDIFGYKLVDKYFIEPTPIGKKTIPAGMSIADFEIEKISGGGRSFKSRDFFDLIGSKGFEDTFLKEEGDIFKGQPTIFSSQSRALGATSEAEVLTSATRIRVGLPETKVYSFNIFGREFNIFPREVTTKLGFADAYLNVNHQMIPINVERLMTTTTSIVPRATRPAFFALNAPDEVRELGYNPPKLLQAPRDNSLMVNEIKTSQRFAFERVGGYSQELQSRFNVITPQVRFAYPQISISQTPSIARPSTATTLKGFNYSPTRGDRTLINTYYNPQKESRSPTTTTRIDTSYTPLRGATYTPNYPSLTRPSLQTGYPNITYPTIKTPNIQEPTIDKKGNDLLFKKKKGKTLGFFAVSRRKGKFITLGEPMPKGMALNEALRFARKTLARTATIKQAGEIDVGEDVGFSLKGFRLPKGKSKLRGMKDLYIQKNALSFKSEVGEIQNARKMKKMFKGIL